jgi:hypothetical protein
MARIVTTAYRPKRPPRKRKAVAIAGPAIVRKAVSLPADGQRKPANDDRKPAIVAARGASVAPVPGTKPKPSIVTTTSRKRARLLRSESEPSPEDPEATARVRAFFDRMIRPR